MDTANVFLVEMTNRNSAGVRFTRHQYSVRTWPSTLAFALAIALAALAIGVGVAAVVEIQVEIRKHRAKTRSPTPFRKALGTFEVYARN